MQAVLYKLNGSDGRLPTPGNVASIGATATQFRLKQSAPDMISRFLPYSIGKSAARLGSDSVNGDMKSKISKTYPYKTRTVLIGDRKLRNQGVKMMDIKINQGQIYEPRLNDIPRYAWNLKLNEASSDYGSQFADLPYGYSPSPGPLLRGNEYPESTMILGRNPPPPELQQDILFKVLTRDRVIRPLNYTERYEAQNKDNEI